MTEKSPAPATHFYSYTYAEAKLELKQATEAMLSVTVSHDCVAKRQFMPWKCRQPV